MNDRIILVALIIVIGLGIMYYTQNKPQQQPVQQQSFTNPYPQTPQQPQQPQQQQPQQPEFEEFTSYTGPWNTVKNRKLDGIQTADVHYLGNHQWEGRFHGTWRGVSYSYDVTWEGPPDNLRGVATIDGANYTWVGKITPEVFVGQFESGRYTGDFNQKRDRKSEESNRTQAMLPKGWHNPSISP